MLLSVAGTRYVTFASRRYAAVRTPAAVDLHGRDANSQPLPRTGHPLGVQQLGAEASRRQGSRTEATDESAALSAARLALGIRALDGGGDVGGAAAARVAQAQQGVVSSNSPPQYLEVRSPPFPSLVLWERVRLRLRIVGGAAQAQ